MIILAIETSCDDTCIALIKASGKKSPRFEILSNIVSSQVKIHRKWGGVYPTLAKREHQKNLVPVLARALKEARILKKTQNSWIRRRLPGGLYLKSQNHNSKLKTLKEEILIREKMLFKHLKSFLSKYQKPKVDLIAVTIGPGLEPCLWVGVNFAKALTFFWNLPIVPVNHIEAHILANWLQPELVGENYKNLFPAICLVVSGGHTQLILMKSFGKYKILGETRDDAAGECFDKIAKILGLGYPGGPEIEQQAAQLKSKSKNQKLKIILPRPMIYQKNYDFSFSGLKTAVLYNFKRQPAKIRKSKKYIREICRETQQAIIDVLIHKTIRAAKEYQAKAIILGGGVVANNELRKQFKERIKKELSNIQYLIPNIQFCTDNAAMVGIAGYYNYFQKKAKSWKKIEARANLRMS